MPQPPGYTIERESDGTYAVSHEHLGLLEGGIPYRSTAEDYAAEHAAEAAADAEHDAIGDFLYAIDRGDFGDALKVGPAADRAESAFVTGLRTVHAARAALSDRSLTAAAHDRGVSLVALVEAA